jgi:hypothetical protein
VGEREDDRAGAGGLDRLGDQASSLAHLDRLVERGSGAIEIALVAQRDSESKQRLERDL